jgi:hypothetical protein
MHTHLYMSIQCGIEVTEAYEEEDTCVSYEEEDTCIHTCTCLSSVV